jgi:hypothetical protein
VVTVKSTGSAPTKAQLAAQMLTQLGGDSSDHTVVVALKQTASIPVADDGTVCGTYDATITAALMFAAGEGFGKATGTWGDDVSGSACTPTPITSSPRTTGTCAWDTGCSITPTCSTGAPSGRRRLVDTHTVTYATETTDDISAAVGGGTTFTASLKAGIQAQVTADSSTLSTVPAIPDITAVDHTAIEYSNEVTYQITSTTATLTTAGIATKVSGALTALGSAAGIDSNAVTAALGTISTTSTADTVAVTVSGAATTAVSTALVAAVAGAMIFML